MTPSHPLTTNVEQCLIQMRLRSTGMAVAVSGGPDSVALLHALLQIREPNVPIVVAHLNHQIRGEESDQDEQFVRDLHSCLISQGYYNLELRCERIDVLESARQQKANLESMARQLRYEWLTQVARECQLDVIATGHSLDDQAETVLHRLLRGAGLQGLRGIAMERELASNIRLVRPLLTTTRTEVLDYLKVHNLETRLDSSNLDLSYTRNRIRLELLPHLSENYNPGIREVLCRLAQHASEAYEEEERNAKELLELAEFPKEEHWVCLNWNVLKGANANHVRAMFRRVWERENWSRNAMSFECWNRLISLVTEELSAADFPGSIRARRRRNVIQIGPIRKG